MIVTATYPHGVIHEMEEVLETDTILDALQYTGELLDPEDLVVRVVSGTCEMTGYGLTVMSPENIAAGYVYADCAYVKTDCNILLKQSLP